MWQRLADMAHPGGAKLRPSSQQANHEETPMSDSTSSFTTDHRRFGAKGWLAVAAAATAAAAVAIPRYRRNHRGV